MKILMEESAMTDVPGKFVLNALGVSLSAEGLVALALCVPVSLLLTAIAYRILRR
jgi:hypothetical protein